MVTGVCKWFNARKGYGFITPDGAVAAEGEKADVFVHHTNIKMEGFRALYEGDKVTFEIADGTKGKEAKNVEIVERAPRPKRRRGPRKEGAGEGAAEDAPKDAPADAANAGEEEKPKKSRSKMKSDSEAEAKSE
ncbi:MAG: cold shock domain-containing protein [Candidatus Lokiarchaeota archaeon]|nr:cold shock domain-containing protein [Candidatus Lokiarchaeota archaeon]